VVLKRVARLLSIIILVVIMVFFIDYKIAENVAVRYMKILSIEDSNSYEEAREQIEGISPEEVRNNLFREGKGFEEIKGLMIGIEYEILEKQLYRIEGVRDYSIKIRFDTKGLGIIDSISRVKNWKVVDVYRLDN